MFVRGSAPDIKTTKGTNFDNLQEINPRVKTWKLCKYWSYTHSLRIYNQKLSLKFFHVIKGILDL